MGGVGAGLAFLLSIVLFPLILSVFVSLIWECPNNYAFSVPGGKKSGVST